MQFMMMMKCTKEYEAGQRPDPRLIEAIGKHGAELTKKGILVSSGGLLPTYAGARIHVSSGNMAVTDGPFAETKELIGGFAILNAASKEEAIRLGRQFLQIHIDVLGRSYEGEMEIRQMWGPEGCGSVQEEEVAALQES